MTRRREIETDAVEVNTLATLPGYALTTAQRMARDRALAEYPKAVERYREFKRRIRERHPRGTTRRTGQ